MSGVLPLVLAAQVGLSGVRSAEACSGGGPGEDWDEVGMPSSGLGQVSVGTDAFVLLTRSYHGELDSKDPGAWVRIEDADGAVVAGKLEVLLTRELGDVTERYLGWRANEPVPVGDVLRLTSWRSEAESAEAEGNSIELEVVGEPTPLPTPTVAIKKWGEVAHGVGERTECATWTLCGDSSRACPRVRFAW